MDEEDIKSMIAYIRTLKPVENKVPESSSDFPMNFIINTIPRKAQFTKMPDKNERVNYGKYLVNAGACIECHTKFEKGGLALTCILLSFGFEMTYPKDWLHQRSSPLAKGDSGGLIFRQVQIPTDRREFTNLRLPTI